MIRESLHVLPVKYDDDNDIFILSYRLRKFARQFEGQIGYKIRT